MVLEDVIALTKKAVAQAMGETYMSEHGYLEAIPAEKLIDVGKDVTDAGSTEKFAKAMLSLLGKMEIESPSFKKRVEGLYVDSWEWGGFLERAMFDLDTVIADPMYNLVNGTSYANIEHTFYQPTVDAKIFEEGKAILIPYSLQADAIKDAFNSYEQMNAFLTARRETARATLDFAMEAYKHVLLCAGIAISDGATNTAVHLITEAIADGVIASGSTWASAKTDKDFLAWCCDRIERTRENMMDYSKAFNNGSVPVGGDSNFYVLDEFRSAVKNFLTPHEYNDVVKLPNGSSVTYWQSATDSTGNSYGFDTTSSIKLAADTSNKLGLGTSAVTVNGAVALLVHKKALGITLNKFKVTSNYTACADFWNDYLHALVNYVVDSRFSMVAFIMD